MKQKNLLDDSIFLLCITFIFLFLTYHQVFISTETGKYASDTLQHIQFAKNYDEGKMYIPHPLWHLSTLWTSNVLHISVELASVLCSTFFLTLWSLLVLYVVKSFLHYTYDFQYILVSFIILIIGPLNIPWYNKMIFLGQGSPNIWHNITLWTVKPFALLSMFFIIKAIQTKKNLYYILTLVSLLTSLFAKPSFAIMFLPALAIFALIKKISNKQFIIFYIILGTISAGILLYQFTHTFSTGESKIVFDYLGVWSQSSQNIALSILFALAFPLLLLFLELSIIQDDYILLSWLQIFIGILFYALLAQTGKYYSHGNFAWSYVLAMSLLYLFSIVKYFEIYTQIHKFKKYLLSSLLLIQTFIGLYYFVKVLQGQNPLYIAIFL